MPGHAVHLENHFMIGMSIHDGFRIPFPPLPQKFLYLDFMHQLRGWNNWQSNLSVKVLGPGSKELVGIDSDMGWLIPHIPVPPMDLLWPLTFLMSSSVSKLGSANVVMKSHNNVFGEDTVPVAVCWWPCAPFSQNLGCNDPFDLPLDFVISPDTIEIQVTCADILRAVASIVIDMVVGKLMELGGKQAVKGAKKLGKKLKKNKMVKSAGQDAFNRTLLKERKKKAPEVGSLIDLDKQAQRRAKVAKRTAERNARRKADKAEKALAERAKEKALEEQAELDKIMDHAKFSKHGAKWNSPKTWPNVFDAFTRNPQSKSKYAKDYWNGKTPKILDADSARERLRLGPNARDATGRTWLWKGAVPRIKDAALGQAGDVSGVNKFAKKSAIWIVTLSHWDGNVHPSDETPDCSLIAQGLEVDEPDFDQFSIAGMIGSGATFVWNRVASEARKLT